MLLWCFRKTKPHHVVSPWVLGEMKLKVLELQSISCQNWYQTTYFLWRMKNKTTNITLYKRCQKCIPYWMKLQPSFSLQWSRLFERRCSRDSSRPPPVASDLVTPSHGLGLVGLGTPSGGRALGSLGGCKNCRRGLGDELDGPPNRPHGRPLCRGPEQETPNGPWPSLNRKWRRARHFRCQFVDALKNWYQRSCEGKTAPSLTKIYFCKAWEWGRKETFLAIIHRKRRFLPYITVWASCQHHS